MKRVGRTISEIRDEGWKSGNDVRANNSGIRISHERKVTVHKLQCMDCSKRLLLCIVTDAKYGAH